MKPSALLADICELLFPNRCRVCGIWGNDSICETCRESLEALRVNACCARCGRTYIRAISDCPGCRGKRLSYDRIIPVFKYESSIKDLIHSGKYFNDRELLKYLALSALDSVAPLVGQEDTFLCPVPITRKKKRQRGYNQAEVIARELSRKLGIPVFAGLHKVRHTADQNTLNKQERLKNLKGAFFSEKAPPIIILIDDVMTTGATLNECSKELKKNGCRSVKGLVLARA